MRKKFYMLAVYSILSLIIFSNGIVWAADEKASNVWSNFFFSWGPIILLIAVWIFFMRRMGGSGKKNYYERAYEHMEKQEQLLERIAKALEKNTKE